MLYACRQADASAATIALRNGLNANVGYRWLREDADSHAVASARQGGEFIAM